MQIADELSRCERYLPDATFQEVARQRRLRHAQHLRPARQRIALREDLAQAGEIALVIPLSGGELRDGELDAHPEKLAYGRPDRPTGPSRPGHRYSCGVQDRR